LLGKNLVWPYYGWLIRRSIQAHEEFDSKYGLDTQTPIPIHKLEASAPGAQYAIHYEGTAIPLVHKILRRLRTDLSCFTFIDLGSGKGRVLLIAAQYPFKSVIGIEYSETLHRTAQLNISKFIQQVFTKTRPTSFNMDAGAFDFSQFGNKVVFCYNPFAATLALRILDLSPIPTAVKERLDTFHVIAQGSYLSHFGGLQKYYIYRISI
jgi:SAM-dependent methyltransferase